MARTRVRIPFLEFCLAIAGAFLRSRLEFDDKPVLNGLAGIAVCFAIFSYESGRTLFSAFPAVVIYALVFIEFIEIRIRGASRMPIPTEAVSP